MRPKCVSGSIETDPSFSEPMAFNGRLGSLQIFDVAYRDVKMPLACFCDNTSNINNAPMIIQSNSKTMELIFNVNNLNITEDFADIYFYASYEVISVSECPSKTRLKGSGGEEHLTYTLSSQDVSCDGHVWYIEAQQMYRSLFVMTWGYVLPMEPTADDVLRCSSKNRLLVYSGRPLRVVKVICPSLPASPTSALYIYSDDWISMQPSTK